MTRISIGFVFKHLNLALVRKTNRMSSSVKEIGVVVVGLGIAGKVRIRDLKEESCGLRFRGAVSRSVDNIVLSFSISITSTPVLQIDFIKI